MQYQPPPALLPDPHPPGAVVVLTLAEVAPGSRVWGLLRFVIGRHALRRVDGLRFFKLLGSGHQGGFGLRPSGSHQALLCVFDDDAAADRYLDASHVAAAYRRHAAACFSVKLRAFSSRGSWAGRTLPVSTVAPDTGPIAALTRASIHPARALRFWQRAPAAERDLAAAAGCLLATGLGEAPLLRQATFSVWQDIASMEAYARNGAHLAAIRAAQQEGYFAESMFVRFVPYAPRGAWKGYAPGTATPSAIGGEVAAAPH